MLKTNAFAELILTSYHYTKIDCWGHIANKCYKTSPNLVCTIPNSSQFEKRMQQMNSLKPDINHIYFENHSFKGSGSILLPGSSGQDAPHLKMDEV